MLVIQRGLKLYKGFKGILEDLTEEIPTWKIFNGFMIDDEEPVQNEAEKRKDDDVPIKKMKLG